MTKWLFLFFLGFTSGIAIRSFLDFGIAFSVFILLLGVIFYLVKFSLRAFSFSYLIYISIFLVALGLGMIRFDIADLNKGTVALDAQINKRVVLEGIVVDEPDVRETHTKLTVEIIYRPEDIVFSSDPHRPHPSEKTISSGLSDTSKLLVITEHHPEFLYGDKVVLTGELQKPKNFQPQDNIGRTFDYIAYLAKDGIFYQMFYPEIELVVHGQGNKIKETIFSFKRKLLENVTHVIPEPHASLAGGITLGTKQSLGKELLDDFRKTGIIHIVVLSGYNISIVAEAVARIATFAPKLLGSALSVFTILAFAIMTGAGATVVRASIMALLVLLARTTGRVYEITIALFVAAFFMILYNPKILIFDASFQLSFLATLGLIYLAPNLERFFGWLPTKWQFREFATATIAAQLAVLPLLLYMMGELSIVSFVVNLLILPIVPITMLFVFLTSVTGFLYSIISLPFAYVSYALLEYQLKIVDIFSSLSFASVTVPYFPFMIMLGMYGVYGFGIYFIHKNKKLKIVKH